MQQEIYTKVIQILAETAEVDENTINLETNIIEDIGINSLQMITFLLKIEEEFKIEFDYDSFDLTDVSNAKKIAEYISHES